MKKMKIVYPSSDWASNLGNPFFNLGFEYVLKEAAKLAGKEVEILFTASNPEKSFKTKGRFKENTFNSAKYFSGANILVLAGPLFDISFARLFEETLKSAKEQGIKVFIISAGGIKYDSEEIQHCRQVLQKYPPYVLSTRDRDTYGNYHDLAEHSLDGICGAWFAPDYYSGYDTEDLGKYVTFTFDHAREPKVELNGFVKNQNKLNEIEVSDLSHSKKAKVMRLLQRGLPKSINKFTIVRPNHCVLNRPNWRLFFKPNSFISQTPYGLLNLYRNTDLTLTDRLHASVATLAYGNPAFLVIKSKRIKLLDRINGASEVIKRPTKLDMNYLNNEKKKVVDWFVEIFNSIEQSND